ncbi:hotdog fold thioesterase [Flavobacterium sp.]|uniref:PaaI family thioesterase n=1 Tax=Flavobacterium sp. TaxID=239 RepID=UPI002B4AC14D|nr:hotdog fold thioesterase [Flavobacterium sp.]HLP65568.1 hotdog fold thioesterase [Flavobacterium sp.]
MTPKEIVNKMFQNDAFSQWLGITVENVSEGTCTLSMEIRKEMTNGFGIAHGGITYSLADSALAFAVNSHGRQSVSIDTSINHIETLKEGDKIVAVAKQDALKNKFGFYTIEIKREEKIVALFKGTVFRSDKEWGNN